MSEPEHSADYVWHFKLLEDDDSSAGGEEALTAMVSRQVTALLRCIQFTSDGQDVRVTGFRFLDDPSHEHGIRPSLADAVLPEAE